MNGAEINEKVCEYGIAGGNMEIIHLIEQKGMKFINCLKISVEYHHYELFEWLNTHFEYEYVSLQNCLEYNNLPVFYYYVKECKCDVESKDNNGWTPLHIASWKGHLSIVEYLTKECKCDVESKDKNRWTPLHIAS